MEKLGKIFPIMTLLTKFSFFITIVYFFSYLRKIYINNKEIILNYYILNLNNIYWRKYMLLLISPINHEEALESIKGGADIVDVKNPKEGSLGAK